MNTNLLKEDEQALQRKALKGLGRGELIHVKPRVILGIISNLSEARAEKYEFAAQQLEELLKSVDGIFNRDAIMFKIAELRRLANG